MRRMIKGISNAFHRQDESGLLRESREAWQPMNAAHVVQRAAVVKANRLHPHRGGI